MPDKMELKLSDAFCENPKHGMYEWTAVTKNINKNYNEGLSRKYKALNDYQIFVSKTKEYKEDGLKLEEAVDKSVDRCIHNDIMKEYLVKQKTKVVGMVLTEYDEEKTLKAIGQEFYEDGVAYGI